MKITIDSKVVEDYHINLDEFLVLLMSARNIDIEKCKESLIDKKLGNPSTSDDKLLILSNEVKDMVAEILVSSDSNVIDKDEELRKLAIELQKLYPQGRKEGTTYTWRGTTVEITKKLKTLIAKYGYTFTKEQAIKATKEYVNSFNGNYRYMKLLKYFILKAELDADDNKNVTSELMSYIENEEHINKSREEWATTLK